LTGIKIKAEIKPCLFHNRNEDKITGIIVSIKTFSPAYGSSRIKSNAFSK